MTEPNAELLQTCKLKIVAAGLIWPVPYLGMEGNSIVAPIVRRFFPILQMWRASSENPKFSDLIDVITEDGVKDLYLAMWQCLKRGHKGMTFDEFKEMPILVPEIILSFTTIAAATGMVTFREADDKDPPPLLPPTPAAPPTTSQ